MKISKFPRGSARSLKATFLPVAVGIWIADAGTVRLRRLLLTILRFAMWNIAFDGNPVSRRNDGHEML